MGGSLARVEGRPPHPLPEASLPGLESPLASCPPSCQLPAPGCGALGRFAESSWPRFPSLYLGPPSHPFHRCVRPRLARAGPYASALVAFAGMQARGSCCAQVFGAHGRWAGGLGGGPASPLLPLLPSPCACLSFRTWAVRMTVVPAQGPHPCGADRTVPPALEPQCLWGPWGREHALPAQLGAQRPSCLT